MQQITGILFPNSRPSSPAEPKPAAEGLSTSVYSQAVASQSPKSQSFQHWHRVGRVPTGSQLSYLGQSAVVNGRGRIVDSLEEGSEFDDPSEWALFVHRMIKPNSRVKFVDGWRCVVLNGSPLNDALSAPLECLPNIIFTGVRDQRKASILSSVPSGMKMQCIESEICDASVTHLVTEPDQSGLCARTCKYLSALVLKKPVVSVSWLEESFAQGSWLAVDGFLIGGDTVSGRTEAPLLALRDGGFLFQNCSFSFARYRGTNPKRELLESLVSLGGGAVTKGSKNGIFVVEESKRLNELSAGTLIEAISSYKFSLEHCNAK